tara:strand:- start:231 stop:590 length:360 start_codon:yes stop_codon:yes gene_type:complete
MDENEIPYKKFGLTKTEYHEFNGSLGRASYHVYTDFEEDGECAVLYFDGDEGAALFSSVVDSFEGSGFNMKLIGCNYCDIPFTMMEEILEIFKEYENGVLEHLFEIEPNEFRFRQYSEN